jgi:hypothetical protein
MAGAAALGAWTMPPALAQSGGVVEALILVADYFESATRVIVGLNAGAARVRPRRLKSADRAAATAQIGDLQAELKRLRARQRIVLGDIEGYIADVRAAGFQPTRHGPYWSSIRQDLGEVNDIVGLVRERLVSAKWLKASIEPSDLLALDEVLLSRADLIARLRQINPPQSGVELDALARMKASYDRLRAELAILMLRLDDIRGQSI